MWRWKSKVIFIFIANNKNQSKILEENKFKIEDTNLIEENQIMEKANEGQKILIFGELKDYIKKGNIQGVKEILGLIIEYFKKKKYFTK